MTASHMQLRVATALPEGATGRRKRNTGVNLEGLRDAIDKRLILTADVVQVDGEEIQVLLASNGLGGHLIGVMAPEEYDDRTYEGYDGFVGDRVDVLVTGYDLRRGVAQVSRKQARALKREVLAKKLAVGAKVTGVVHRFASFAAFLDIGGLDAVLPVQEISWGYVNHPQDVLSRGDELEVLVLEFDLEKNKARVSLKALQEPWDQVQAVYKRNATVLGTITGTRDDRVWVRPEPYHGVDIMCPAIGQRPYTEGKRVRVKLINVDAEQHRLRGKIIGSVR